MISRPPNNPRRLWYHDHDHPIIQEDYDTSWWWWWWYLIKSISNESQDLKHSSSEVLIKDLWYNSISFLHLLKACKDRLLAWCIVYRASKVILVLSITDNSEINVCCWSIFGFLIFWLWAYQVKVIQEPASCTLH